MKRIRPLERVDIKINKKQITEAENRTKKLIIAVQGMNPGHFQTKEYTNRYYGCLGEVVFEDWLKENKITFLTEKKYGEADNYDVLANGSKIDVKTGSLNCDINCLSPKFRFLIVKEQAEKNKSDIYVQILIHLGVAHITGWIHSKDLHKYDKESCEDIKIIHKCIGIPIAHLAPPSLLLSVLGTDLS